MSGAAGEALRRARRRERPLPGGDRRKEAGSASDGSGRLRGRLDHDARRRCLAEGRGAAPPSRRDREGRLRGERDAEGTAEARRAAGRVMPGRVMFRRGKPGEECRARRHGRENRGSAGLSGNGSLRGRAVALMPAMAVRPVRPGGGEGREAEESRAEQNGQKQPDMRQVAHRLLVDRERGQINRRRPPAPQACAARPASPRSGP